MTSLLADHSRRIALGTMLCGLLGASALLGLLVGSGRLVPGLLLVAVALAMLAALLLIHYFETMVLAIIVACLAIPYDLPTGTATNLPVSFLMSLSLCAIWSLSMFTRRSWRLSSSALNLPIFVFGGLCCVSFVWGTLWRDPVVSTTASFPIVQTTSLLSYLASLGTTLLIGNFAQTPARLRFLLVTMVAAGAVIMICLLANINQPVLSARGLGLLWTTVAAYALLLAEPRLALRWKAALLGVVGLWFVWQVLINATWLSGWIPTGIALAVATWLRSKRLAIVLSLIGIIVIALGMGFLSNVFEADQESGSTGRLDIWKQSWQIISAHWLFGTGPAGYKPYLNAYFPADTRSSHNNYVDIVSQFGFAGFAAWIWLAAAGVIEGWNVCRRAPPGVLRAAAITATGGWIGAQVGMFFGDWVLPFAYNISVSGFKFTVFTWMFLGMIISVRAQLERPTHAESA